MSSGPNTRSSITIRRKASSACGQHGRWALFDYLGRRLTEFGEADDREETD